MRKVQSKPTVLVVAGIHTGSCIATASTAFVPLPVKVILNGVGPATHVLLEVARPATNFLIRIIFAVWLEIAFLLQVYTAWRAASTLETCRGGRGWRGCRKTLMTNQSGYEQMM